MPDEVKSCEGIEKQCQKRETIRRYVGLRSILEIETLRYPSPAVLLRDGVQMIANAVTNLAATREHQHFTRWHVSRIDVAES